MAKLMDAIFGIVTILLTLGGVNNSRSMIFMACTFVVMMAVSVWLKKPVLGIDLLLSILLFGVLRALSHSWTLLSMSFAVPVFAISLVMEMVMRRYDKRLFSSSAAVAVAAIVVGRHPLGLDYDSSYDGMGPVAGAVIALFICQAILNLIKKESLVRLALPAVVVVVGWVVGTLIPVEPQDLLDAFYALFGFFLPSFALPAVAGVAIVEVVSKRQKTYVIENKAV
jgi:hypothetical protein